MARALLDRNRAREARRQARLLNRLAAQFRPPLERELSDAMFAMISHWEHTGSVDIPRGFVDRVNAIYWQMVDAAIRTFAERILDQGKTAGLLLEHKFINFGALMQKLATAYIAAEAIRRRIMGVTEATRRQIIFSIERGYQAGTPTAEIAKNIRTVVPSIARVRANVIARTETHGAANFGSNEAAKATGLPLRREWLAAHDLRTRTVDPLIGDPDEFGHLQADGQKVGMEEPFLIPRQGGTKEALMFPGDPKGSPGNTINCFAPWSMIHKGGLKGAMRREYIGELIELTVRGPINLAVTPNHPILTERGWVPAGQIKEGDNLIKCGIRGEPFAGVNPKIQNGFSSAQELYDLAHALGGAVGAGGINVDLHGEVVPSKDVNIVAFKGDLLAACNSPGTQLLKEFSFSESDIAKGFLLSLRMLGLRDVGSANDADRTMGGVNASKPLFGREKFGPARISFRDAWAGDAHIIKATADHRAGNPDLLCDSENRITFLKESLDFGMMFGAFREMGGADHFCGELASVISMRRVHYAGPVLNFESDNGLLIAEGIVTHNCRCTIGFIVDDGLDDDEQTTPS